MMIKIKYLFFLIGCCSINAFSQHQLVLEEEGTLYQSGGEIVLHNTSFVNNSGANAFYSAPEGKVRISGFSLERFSKLGGLYPSNFSTLIIDKGYNNSILEQNISITKELLFSAGHLDLQDHNLTLQYGSKVVGSDKDAYIKTTGEGILRAMHLGEELYFPIGNSTFNPLTVNDLGYALTELESYEAKVMDIDASEMGDLPENEIMGVLPRVWHLHANNANDELIQVTVQWEKSEEPVEFDRSSIHINYLSADNTWKFIDEPQSASGQNPYTLSGAISKNSDMITVISQPKLEGLRIPTQALTSSITESLQLYPNPTSDYLHLRFAEAINAPLVLTIRNIHGQIVQQESIGDFHQQKMSFNVHSLIVGHYFLEITKNNTHYKTLPFVIVE